VPLSIVANANHLPIITIIHYFPPTIITVVV